MQRYENTYLSANKGIKLYPTISQFTFLNNCIDGYTTVYNWALEKLVSQLASYMNDNDIRKTISFFDLSKMYKGFRDSNAILQSLPLHTMENAIKDAIQGVEMHFKCGNNIPSYKIPGTILYSNFKPRYDRFYFDDNYIKIEGLKDMILTGYHSGYHYNDNIKYINPVIIRNNRTMEFTLTYVVEKQKLDNYFIENNIQISEPLGIDINKRKMYACSNGLNIQFVDTQRIENHINTLNSKIQNDRFRYNEDLKINPNAKLSNTSIQRLEQRKRLYEHLANIHKNTAYKGSLEIIRLRPSVVILETINFQNIMSDRYMKQQLQSHPLGIAQRILIEQLNKYNIPVAFAPKDFQSSNICSNCGSYKNIRGYKNFYCSNCGISIGRDTNAAINLKKWYLSNI